MNLVPVACCLFATLAFQVKVEAAPSCDLKTIFRTPRSRNYDQFEILERSNFDSSSETSKDSNTENGGRNINNPNSFANAQVLLRFGSDSHNERRPSCNCNQCQCPPYYYPSAQCFCLPYPYYYPQYPYYSNQLPQATEIKAPPSLETTPKSEAISEKSPVKPVYEETTPTIITSTQEEVTEPLTVTPSDKTETTNSDGLKESTKYNDDYTFYTETTEQSTPLSPNVKMVTVTLSKEKIDTNTATPSGRAQKALNDALVQYTPSSSSTGPVTFPTTTKKLLTYPIFEKPPKQPLNVERRLDGQFSKVMLPLSSGSGYYSGMQKQQAVFYREPEVLSIVKKQPVYYPQQLLLPGYQRGSYSRYVCVPVPSSVPRSFYGNLMPLPPRRSEVEHHEGEEHEQDCCCPGCRAKYVGEFNEMVF